MTWELAVDQSVEGSVGPDAGLWQKAYRLWGTGGDAIYYEACHPLRVTSVVALERDQREKAEQLFLKVGWRCTMYGHAAVILVVVSRTCRVVCNLSFQAESERGRRSLEMAYAISIFQAKH